MPPDYLRIREAADLLGLAESTVRSMLTTTKQKRPLQYAPREAWPDGRTPLITRASVEEYLTTRRTRKPAAD
jgi:hypothetical protein